MLLTKPVVFVVISFLVAALIYSPSSIFSVPNRANSDTAVCTSAGQSPSGLELVECCWMEETPGTDYEGGDKEMYCSECENGGTRGMINCSDPELQYLTKGGGETVFPNDGGVLEQPPTPLPKGQGVLPQGGVLEQPQGADQGLIPLDDPGLVLPPIGEVTTVPQTGQGAEVPQTGEAALPDQGTPSPIDEATQPSSTPPLSGNDANVLDGQTMAKDEDDDDDDDDLPPECPLTGPIPPNCTMRPKFPTENAPN